MPWPFLLPPSMRVVAVAQAAAFPSSPIVKVVKEITVGAVPKKRVSSRRQGNRRQHHKIKLPQLKVCPQCRQYRLSHHACPNCGTYRGRQVLPIKERRTAAE